MLAEVDGHLRTYSTGHQEPVFKASDRKLRLFVAAGMRIVLSESKLPPVVEKMADDPSILPDRRWWPTDTDVAGACRCVVTASRSPLAAVQLCNLLRDIVGSPFRPVTLPPNPDCSACRGSGTFTVGSGEDAERMRCRCCPWLTHAVVSLAQAAYDERDRQWVGRKHDHDEASGWEEDGHLDPFRLALVADALEEAGCNSVDLLRHLRGRACDGSAYVALPHVRGCWAVDLVLGRE